VGREWVTMKKWEKNKVNKKRDLSEQIGGKGK
jgi:hypothetical protein